MRLDYIAITPDEPLPEIEKVPTKALVIIGESTSLEWRKLASQWLVDLGCLTVSTWGFDCEAWHDQVDWQLLEEFEYSEIPESRFILSAWHDHDTIEDAMWFVAHSAFHPSEAMERTLIVDVTGTSREALIMAQFGVQLANDLS